MNFHPTEDEQKIISNAIADWEKFPEDFDKKLFKKLAFNNLITVKLSSDQRLIYKTTPLGVRIIQQARQT